ncbi:MAG: NADH-quinone oxidoreductase subunit NuoF [Syntrophorhabdales bacterium]
MNRLRSTSDLEAFRARLREESDPNRMVVRICMTGCRAYGAEEARDAFVREIRRRGLEQKVEIRETGCHGFCARAPVAAIDPLDIFYQQFSADDVPEIVSQTIERGTIIDRLTYPEPLTEERIAHRSEIPFYKGQTQIVLRNCGKIDPRSIEQYIARDGYAALGRVLTMKPEAVVEEVKRSGLRGRGGAGFPTGVKWSFFAAASGDTKYLICNADEGDPGAFMDRAVLEGDPHSVMEGMLIAAYATGATHGYVYVRAEYPIAVEHLKIATGQARQLGLLGENILGSGLSFDLTIKEGAGAFVCGEETALIASIEGRRGTPRPRPPFPAQSGLWGKPTNINNVETFANIAPIILKGADWYASMGTESSKGTKIFSLAGRINNTGLVEVPIGVPLHEVVFRVGGGIPRERQFKAVQMGGPSGGCVPMKHLNLPIDYGSLESVGAIMGSGGMVVMDQNTCMVDVARFFLSFTQSESCGKCVPCRLGTKRMLEILTRITKGEGREGDIELLEEVGKSVKDASLCGLGQTSPNPVLSTIRHFREEYEAHIKHKRCPAGVCDALVFAPCENTCPVRCDAVGYVSLVAAGRYEEALDLIRLNMPLPGICGRVCNHPCEKVCKRGEIDDPVAISALKRFAADWEIKQGRMAPPTFLEKAKDARVAVVGSGPAGLNAAYQLGRRGYKVTIFEALPLAGGMLAVGIPSFRLPRQVLEHDIAFICQHNVEIVTGRELGRDFTVRELLAEGYKAVFLAMGAHLDQKLNIPGEDAQGVLRGVEFLRRANLGEKVAIGQRVAIIGGGNVAMDAARMVLRFGAKSVTIIYRRTREEMPANIEEIEEAEDEKITFLYLLSPTRIVTEDGRVTGIECQKMKLGEYDASGRARPVPIPDSEILLPVDTVIPEIGYVPQLTCLKDGDAFSINRNGTLAVDPLTLATDVPGVFAGGDVVTGPSTIVEAMAGGYRAAVSIDRYLKGQDPAEDRVYRPLRRADVMRAESEAESGAEKERYQMPYLGVGYRVRGFSEVNLGFDEETAVLEAKRCLRCDLEKRRG